MKSHKSYRLAFVFALLVISHCKVLSQSERPYRIIKTNEYMEILSKNDSTVQKKIIEFEKYYNDIKGQNISFDNNIVIPIVFHIVLPDAESITFDIIDAQIEALNKHFNFGEREYFHQALESEGFGAIKEDINVSFCLAKNNGKEAIFKYYTNQSWKFESNEIFSENSGIKLIDPKHYLNIIICNLDEDVSGFAQMPGGKDISDAIVINKDFLLGGKYVDHYGQGKTLVHLIGNFYGLKSLWQNDCQDDGVLDTPIHNSPNFDCPDYKHITTCDGHAVEMSMNYMDNTDDECLSMFTRGQQQRFYASLLFGGPRSSFNNSDDYCDIVVQRSKLSSRVEIFPNPATGVINAIFEDYPSQEVRIKMFNAQGMEILNNAYTDKWVKVVLPDNAEGLHIIEVSVAGSIIKTKKIIIIKN